MSWCGALPTSMSSGCCVKREDPNVTVARRSHGEPSWKDVPILSVSAEDWRPSTHLLGMPHTASCMVLAGERRMHYVWVSRPGGSQQRQCCCYHEGGPRDIKREIGPWGHFRGNRCGGFGPLASADRASASRHFAVCLRWSRHPCGRGKRHQQLTAQMMSRFGSRRPSTQRMEKAFRSSAFGKAATA